MSEIVVTVASYEDSYDFDRSDVLLVNGQRVFSVSSLCECPEDAMIGRDLISSEQIASFLKKFLVDFKGKQVRFEFIECKSADEFEKYQYGG